MTPEQIEQLIRELLKTGEVIASEGFRIAMKQVGVQIFQNFVASVMFVVGTIVASIWAKKEQEFLIWLIAVVFSIAAVLFASDAIARMMNPEWYAIKTLLSAFGFDN